MLKKKPSTVDNTLTTGSPGKTNLNKGDLFQVSWGNIEGGIRRDGECGEYTDTAKEGKGGREVRKTNKKKKKRKHASVKIGKRP